MRPFAAALAGLLGALAGAGCGLLQSPDVALVELVRALEAAPPELPLYGGKKLKLVKLRVDPPTLAPSDGGEVRVSCGIWAEGSLGAARVLFHGPDDLVLRRPDWFSPWQLQPALPRLRGVALALAARVPPSGVSEWAVGLSDPSSGEAREQYTALPSGRPARAAGRLALIRAADGRWVLSDR